mmetsp:Transcript_42910/g.67298  ORF Transcript_42910/g.67298 Transcript_42910/m.67298 type:complete len:217 (+) Transcript_42910:395-1045(+)|eukprot:CAMPEP_0184315072 /NCGR_PEP_ID=MMETSP1049-20130417/79797_1 /TAXON_ID=77928 /ORGANISM="Proteomonas sulcata, Strain CCMP704" /LENGTH=216 /DNA_ID=CAMNT_0026633353 /DNA_START=289 /DNA_END=939 /DNA_ORIENTATION=+
MEGYSALKAVLKMFHQTPRKMGKSVSFPGQMSIVDVGEEGEASFAAMLEAHFVPYDLHTSSHVCKVEDVELSLTSEPQGPATRKDWGPSEADWAVVMSLDSFWSAIGEIKWIGRMASVNRAMRQTGRDEAPWKFISIGHECEFAEREFLLQAMALKDKHLRNVPYKSQYAGKGQVKHLFSVPGAIEVGLKAHGSADAMVQARIPEARIPEVIDQSG